MSLYSDPSYQEIAQSFSDSAADHIFLYAQKYFKKEKENLTREENDHIDNIGLFGCIDWLEENGFIEKSS